MMQLLIPMICMYVLLVKSKDPFDGAICFWFFNYDCIFDMGIDFIN